MSRLLVLVVALGACVPYELTNQERALTDAGIELDFDGDVIGPPDTPQEGGGADAPGEGGGADAPGEGGGVDAGLDAGGVDAGIEIDAGIPVDAGVADAPIGVSDAPSGTPDADPGITLDASTVDAPRGLNPLDDDGLDDQTSFYTCSSAATPLSAIPLVLAIAFAIRRRRATSRTT